MPLRCIEPESGEILHSFDFSPETWDALAAENRRRGHLRMPCCATQVSLRRSKLGTRYFAHRSASICTTAPETEAHLRLKQLVVEVAREHGWAAETEVAGQTSSGEPWRADVLAHRGAARVAVEIQWSSQTHDETRHRQERYAQSGVRGLWLFRQASFPVEEGLPAARLLGTPETGFRASLPDLFERERQVLPMHEFLTAAFSRRLRFGLPLGVEARIVVHGARLTCRRCQARTQILKDVEVETGPHRARLSVSALGRRPGLWDSIRPRLPSSFPSSSIRPRISKTHSQKELSNGCSHCGAPIGERIKHEVGDEPYVISEFAAPLDETWRGALLSQEGSVAAWGVY